MRRVALATVAILGVFSLIIILLSGNTGFFADDWRLLAPGYWADLPQSLQLSMQETKRILLAPHVLALYEVAAFYAPAYRMLSIGTHLINALLMGLCLALVFPRQRFLTLLAVIIAFFTPALSILALDLAFEGGRLSVLWFWLSIISYIQWLKGRHFLWLIGAVLTYTLSLLAYENAILGLPVTLLLCAPLLLRESPRSWRSVAVWLGGIIVGHGISFVLLWMIRNASQLPFHSALASTLPLARIGQTVLGGFVSLVPATSSWHPLGLVLGLGVGIGLIALLATITDSDNTVKISRFQFKETHYVIGVGLVLFVAGLVPYLLAGYTGPYTINGSSRVYSLASYGAAMLIAGMLSLITWSRLRLIGLLVVAGWLVLVVNSLVIAIETRQVAEEERQLLYRALVETAPDLTPNTTLMLLDFKRPSFGGGSGLAVFIPILYNDPSIRASFLNSLPPGQSAGDVSDDLKARVLENGVRPPGSQGGYVPGDEVVVLQYKDGQVIVRPTLERDDLIAIDWADETERIVTNPDRILPDPSALNRLTAIGILHD